MLIQPTTHVVQALAASIEKGACETNRLDDPTMAAVHLKSKEDLELFYAGVEPGEWNATTVAVTYGIQVAVAVLATLLAAHNGLSYRAIDSLDTPPSGDVQNVHLADLIKMRQCALTQCI